MKPAEPVADRATLMRHLPCGSFDEIVYAKDQPPYLPLPVVRIRDTGGLVISRWHLSLMERLRVLFTGNLFLSQLTFNQPLQPIKPTTTFGEDFDEPRGEAYEEMEGATE